MIAPLFRIDPMRGCSCTGNNQYYPQGAVDAYVHNLREICNDLLAENALLKQKLKDRPHEAV